MYQFLYDQNKDRLGNVALNYFDNKITYKDFFDNVDHVAKALYQSNIRQGDIVSIVSLGTPETIYCIYALNRIGAVANLLTANITSSELEQNIIETKTKLLFVLDIVADKIGEFNCRVPVIYLSISDSVRGVKKLLLSLKKRSKQRMSFKSFLNKEKGTFDFVENNGEELAIVVYTSGSTGNPKGVMLSNRNINAEAIMCSLTGKNYVPGEKFLNNIPPFFSFGIGMMHLAFSTGMTVVVALIPETKNIIKMMKKYRPERYVMGPAFTDVIEKYDGNDLSFLVDLTGGGGAISEEQETELNRRLKKCNCSLEYITGYGMTEFGATVCTNMNRCKRYRSLGIPFAKANVKVIDIESKQELKYGQVGEIYFSTPSLMKGYWGRADNEDFIIDNGEKWFATGDLGHVDEDGFVFFDGRIKRIFITRDVDGTVYKVFPQRIEEAIMSHPAVELCGTVGREDKERTTVMISFVKMKSNSSCVSKEEILRFLSYKLSTYAMPEDIVFVDEIPTTQSGKIDYRELEKH